MNPISTSLSNLLRHPIAAGLALAVLPVAAFGQQVTHNQDLLADNPALPELVRGNEAIALLGARLPEIARRSDMTPEAFERHMLTDESLWVDPNGNVIFIDPLHVDSEEVDVDTTQYRPDNNGIPTSQAFLLHSRPGSNFTIYLDFTGHHSVNNGWGHDIMFPPFNRSGSSASFSTSELNEIIANWRHISEDFAPFDVDVTTEEPPLGRLRKTGGGDNQWGVRDIHTQATDGFGNGIGGVAGLWSFSSSLDQPVFSFNKGSNNGAMTGSHEVGHSLGLLHDGLNGSSYHPGASTGGFSWGPIMGAPFNADVVQWSNGDYSGSTTTQNDAVVITDSTNGVTLLPDDYLNGFAGASELAGACPNPNSVEVCGLIEWRSDVDAFKFTSTGGLLTIDADPADFGPNLDIWLRLYDPSQNLLASLNPTRDQTVSLSQNIGTGVHTILIDGGAQPNLYSDYGSRGHYLLDLTLPGPTGHFTDLGMGLAGQIGIPILTGTGFACEGETVSVSLGGARANSTAFLTYGKNRIDQSFLGGILVPDVGPGGGFLTMTTNGFGQASVSDVWPAGAMSGAEIFFQYWIEDAVGPQGFSASNAAVITVP